MKLKEFSSKFIAKYASGFICLLILIACSNAAEFKREVFRYNEQSGIATLDPAFAKNESINWVVHQIYNTLVEPDEHLNIVGSLAKSWEISVDRLIYIFHLSGAVYFQDNDAFPKGRGRKLVAKDVEYSFKRLINRNTASSGAWIFNGRIDSLNGFKAINDSTFQIRLRKPFSPILGLLSMSYCSVVPKEVVERYGKDFRNHPCGTGPFQFASWEEGQALILVKNPHYFEKDEGGNALPYLDAIKISFFDNKATEFLLFQQGQLDFLNDIDVSFKDEVLSKKGELKENWEGKIRLSKHPFLNTEFLGILVDSASDLVKHSPLRFKKVRQAINYGIDRRKMMMYLRNSIGTPAESGFIPMGFPCFDSSVVKGYHYDPEKAKQLLSEAGFPEGVGMPETKLLTIDVYADLAGFIAKELEEIGIPVQVEIVQKGLLLEETAKSQVLFYRGSWIADYPDAENYLSVFYSKNPAPPNYTRYTNPAFDLLYEKSLLQINDSVRYNLYQQMDQMVIDDAPVVPLWYDEVIRLVHENVLGFTSDALNRLELRRVKITRTE
jgi:peptide/nickel transport system substrate-binding protein